MALRGRRAGARGGVGTHDGKPAHGRSTARSRRARAAEVESEGKPGLVIP